ncbi:MAG: isoprenylcysteine carboxylmethyltransferase family protein, partial [Chloroflexota bacterium]
VVAVGAGRLAEMRISRRNQAYLLQNGGKPVTEPYFHVMVAFHSAVLVASVIEVIALNRPFIPVLGIAMLAIFIACTALRGWVIRTLAQHWNVQIMNSLDLGVVESGPYRYIRHPNYVAVYVELIAVPLIHTAVLTALIGAAIHLWILYHRIRVEESMLMTNEAYRAVMGSKPRFIPRLPKRSGSG